MSSSWSHPIHFLPSPFLSTSIFFNPLLSNMKKASSSKTQLGNIIQKSKTFSRQSSRERSHRYDRTSASGRARQEKRKTCLLMTKQLKGLSSRCGARVVDVGIHTYNTSHCFRYNSGNTARYILYTQRTTARGGTGESERKNHRYIYSTICCVFRCIKFFFSL